MPNTHPRVGRPPGPTPGRGHRPYDPRWGTAKRMAILQTVYAHRHALAGGEVLLCDLAAMIGTSISYLSTTKNSHWGQQILQWWSIRDGEDPDQWSRQGEAEYFQSQRGEV